MNRRICWEATYIFVDNNHKLSIWFYVGKYVVGYIHSSSSSSILLTDIYKGWSKSQHIITDTNIVHLTWGYLNT